MRKANDNSCIDSTSPVASNGYHSALYPAQLPKFLAECRDAGLPQWIVRGEWHEHADASHPVGLLRSRRDGPSSSAAAQNSQEGSPIHNCPPTRCSQARGDRLSGSHQLRSLFVHCACWGSLGPVYPSWVKGRVEPLLVIQYGAAGRCWRQRVPTSDSLLHSDLAEERSHAEPSERHTGKDLCPNPTAIL